MVLVTERGTCHGGAEAILQIARRIWWARPLFALGGIPGARPLLSKVYRAVAKRRTCLVGACKLRANRASDWLPLILLPIGVLIFRDRMPAWVLMWTLAFALFLGCKWLTWRPELRRVCGPRTITSLGYLVGWVGMDAREFFATQGKTIRSVRADRVGALVSIFFGGALLWGVVRWIPATYPLLMGWVGMVGVILLLHFGSFELLAVAWQKAGFNAIPLMREPLRATSLGDFWGRRWNAAFHSLVTQLVFRPLARRIGVESAMLSVFVISGFVHELVISVPARGGYGLPTAYFVTQGLGLMFERSRVGRVLGLSKGWRGWLFTMALVAGPAFYLFPPPFVNHVILPMLNAIGAR